MNTVQSLEALGFDLSESDGEGYLRVRCSCCAAMVINSTPCHERGCPNQSRECRECGCLIPAGESCDCMDVSEGDPEEVSDSDYPEREDEFAGSDLS